MDKESIRSSYSRIQERRKARSRRVPPDAPCTKCGAHAWEPEFEVDEQSWYCFRCGNRGYWQGGTFIQTYKG